MRKDDLSSSGEEEIVFSLLDQSQESIYSDSKSRNVRAIAEQDLQSN